MHAASGRSPAPRLGVVQGRLVESATGELQCFPHGRWREEFDLAAALGLGHIELIVERDFNPENPLLSIRGRKEINAAVAASGVRAASVCLDTAIGAPLEQVLDYLVDSVIPAASEVGAEVAVLALFEESDPRLRSASALAPLIARVGDAAGAAGMRVVLESLLSADELQAILRLVDNDSVGVCVDLGNLTAENHDVPAHIRALGSDVWHVHLKDKDSAGRNVEFGRGNADFGGALAALVEIGFDGLMTMEATRGDDPVTTAGNHIEFLRRLPAWVA